jgi:hypothetical protein
LYVVDEWDELLGKSHFHVDATGSRDSINA